MKTEFIKSQKLADHIYSYRFIKPANFNYIAGQYSEFHLNHKHPDERSIVRWFTLSSAPEQDFIEFTTKHSKGLSSSFKIALNDMSKGTKLDVFPAMGDFVLPLDINLPLIFIIAGIGITPLLSILKHLKITKSSRPIYLFYIATKKEQLNLTNYKDQILDIWTFNSSKEFNTTTILSFIQNKKFKDFLIYLSGPDKMVESLNKALSTKINSLKIISDYFDGY